MAFSNEIKAEFNLTNVEWGLLTGLYFLFFYSIFGIFMGLLGDKFNRVKIIAVGVFLWSIMTAFTGVAKNFYHLIIARAFIGIGESAYLQTQYLFYQIYINKTKEGQLQLYIISAYL